MLDLQQFPDLHSRLSYGPAHDHLGLSDQLSRFSPLADRNGKLCILIQGIKAKTLMSVSKMLSIAR